MSVQTEITRLENAKTALAAAIAGKGVTVPEGTKMDGMAALVSQISGKAKLQGISISTPPTKTEYEADQSFDPSGMVVSADLGEGVAVTVSGYTWTPATFSASDTTVTISFTLDGITKTAQQAVTVTAVSGVLADNDFATIAKVSAKGKASETWSVGDTMPVTINGASYTATIVAFNHHALHADDPNFDNSDYNGGTNKAGITFMLTDLYGTPYRMNSSAVNAGGWNSSYMRTSAMPIIKAAMPAQLQQALRTVSIPTGAGGSSTSIVNSADQLFLPSEAEIASGRIYSVAGEGSRLPYFTAGNSRVLKCNGTAQAWWLRSPHSSYSANFIAMTDSGAFSYYGASIEHYVAACFCI